MIAQDPPNTAQVAAVWLAAGAVVISLAAFVVSIVSVRAARRSAAAAEKNAGIASRKEQHEADQRHDQAGPTFEWRLSLDDDSQLDVLLTVVDGPGRITVDTTIDGSLPWSSGLRGADDGPVPVVTAVDLEPGATFSVALGVLPPYDTEWSERIVPLLLDVRLQAEPNRRWKRRVAVHWQNAKPFSIF